MKETELAKGVIAWLQDMKWDVYQEVQVFSYGAIADIVGLFDGRTWVIEVKTTLSLKVMEQAYHWKPFSNLVSVAVPRGRRGSIEFPWKVLESFGIGLIRVVESSDWVNHASVPVWEIVELVRPQVNRRPGKYLKDSLSEAHKTFAEAGNANKLRWSPFQQTCLDVRKFVEKNPGAGLKQIIDNVKTHYQSVQSAKSCIAKYIQMDVLKGVRSEKDGKKLRFYPDGGDDHG